MLATIVTMVGFIGMMEAVTIASTTMDHARRQTFATQIMSHEIDDLYFSSWTAISALPTASTAKAIDGQFWPDWSATANYAVNRVVSRSGVWYRCILAHANHAPPNATYWTVVAPNGAATTDIVTYSGATFTLARTVTSPNPVTNIIEVNFTVTWTVTTGRINTGFSQGNRTYAIGQDDYQTNTTRASATYTRSMSAWYGKYGLQLSYPRS